MTDVIDFPEKPKNDLVPDHPEAPLNEIILVCQCGCETYNLFADGHMACAYCEDPVNPDRENIWREKLRTPTPAELEVMEREDPKHVRNAYYGNPELARRRVLREVNLWSDQNKVALLIGYNVDGQGQSWMDIYNEEQREWVLHKIEALREYVAGKNLNVISHAVINPEEEADDEQAEESTTQDQDTAAQESPADTGAGGTSDTGDAT